MDFKALLQNIKEYILSKAFWYTVLKITIFVLVVLFAVSLYLKIYTQHNKHVFTPTLLGKQIEEAEKSAAEKGLRVKVIEEIYEGNGEPGSVVDQTPPPNFKVKEGRVIFVTIKSKERKKIRMPKLTDLSLLQAKYELEQAGLKLGKITSVSSPYKNLVLGQYHNGEEIVPGELIEVGEKIDLEVGNGYGVDTTIAPVEEPETDGQTDDFTF